MPALRAGDLKWRVDILRAVPARDAFSRTPGAFASIGKLWAKRRALGAAERQAAEQNAASVDVRFVVRWSALTFGVTPRDRLSCDGVTYEIVGVEEDTFYGRRIAIAISCKAVA